MRAFAAVPGRPAEWPRLAADGPFFADENWLAAMRGRVPGSAYTFVLREAGRVRLALYGTVLTRPGRDEIFSLPYILTGDPPELPLTDETRAARASWRALPRGEPSSVPAPEEWYPHLVVMLPGYECHPLGPLSRASDALAELVGEIVAWARRRELRLVAFLYTPPSTAPLQEALGAAGFVRVPLAYTCELELNGAGFDDYLVTLPRKRRAEVRRELRALARAGVATRVEEVSGRVPDEVVGLKCGHSAKYNGVAADPVKVRARLEALCASSALLFRAEAGETLVGYGLFVPYAGVWYCVSTGMDYARRDARHAYFATVFYEPVRHAYPAGVTRLHYGQGSWQAKLVRGCRAVEVPGWVLALDPLLTPVVAESARTGALVSPLP